MPSPEIPPSHRLIIFGCGYVGRALAQRARDAGWQVEALTRNPDKAAALRSALGVRVVLGDLAEDAWHGELDPVGASVVNCVSGGGGGEAGYARSYRDGMRSLVGWAAGAGVRTIVYTSSTSVYPDSNGDWIGDDAPTAATTPLNTLLLEAESILREAVANAAVPSATILRLAGIYGPGRHYLIDRVRRGVAELPGHGDTHLNLIHRDDAAAALLLAVEKASAGFHHYNLADGHPATKEAIVRWTAARLGVPAPAFNPDLVSARAARRALFDGRPPDRRIEAKGARQALGWSPMYPDFKTGYEAILGS